MAPNPELAVFGAGGHAKVVIATLVAAGFSPSVVYDDDPSLWGHSLFGTRIAPSTEARDRHPKRAVLAIGSNAARARLTAEFPNTEWTAVVHPRAYVHETVSLGGGTVVLAGAVIQPDARIGAHVIVNTSASVDHDCVVNDFVHLGPGSHLAGGVRVGSGTFLAVGATAAVGVEIGRGVTVIPGAVVTRSILEAGTYAGSPASLVGQ